MGVGAVGVGEGGADVDQGRVGRTLEPRIDQTDSSVWISSIG